MDTEQLVSKLCEEQYVGFHAMSVEEVREPTEEITEEIMVKLDEMQAPVFNDESPVAYLIIEIRKGK